MNIQLPEKNKINKRQLILYISIIVFCIISVIIAFYVQFYTRIDIGAMIGLENKTGLGNKTEEEEENLRAAFGTLFTNKIVNEDDRNNNKKVKQNKNLVYTKYEKKESKINSYDLEVHIPYINIASETVDKYNKEIESIFENMTNKVLQSENENLVYTVDYATDIQDDILSVMIKSNLKEGSKAQKVIIQTYNYDLRNNKEITLEEIFKIKQLDINEVQSKIKKEIGIEQQKAQDLKSLGYNIYSRDMYSDIYNIDKTTEFYLSEDALYMIYAYGNQTDTTEMDIVIL